jgi:DNA repair protein RecN (Recombination protein N)
MLVEMRLHNLAVAADVCVTLGDGLNVLTGSTGAGKSLVVEAIRWIRGEKIDPGLLRSGENEASAEALFDLSARDNARHRLEGLGIEISEDHILRLRREWRDGRSRAWIDSRLASASMLQSVCDDLIEVQSQHQQLALLDARGHAFVLDQSPPVRVLAHDYRAHYRDLQETRARIRAQRDRHRALQEQSELIRYQLRELEDADLSPGEIDPLKAEVARLEGGAQLTQNVDQALESLEHEEVGAMAQLRRAQSRLEHCSDDLEEIHEARENLIHSLDLLEETRRGLETFRLDVDLSPERLHEKQSRLGELQSLARKYVRSESELVDLRDRLRRDVENLDLGDETPAALQQEDEERLAALQSAADRLHRARKREARRIEKAASALLEELGMTGAALRFELAADAVGDVELTVDGRPSPVRADGPTAVHLLVRTNVGEGFGPIENTASGGELSRIGLTLRSIAAGQAQATLLLLDEVDAGMGADLGPALSRRLRALADGAQVLVITHLPAVAAAADQHLMAAKSTQDHRTSTTILSLDEKQREEEIQRMIGGNSSQSRRLARQLRESHASGSDGVAKRAGRESA